MKRHKHHTTERIFSTPKQRVENAEGIKVFRTLTSGNGWYHPTKGWRKTRRVVKMQAGDVLMAKLLLRAGVRLAG